ncbi:MAG: aminotransferase class IV [Pseudomonadota bacterium]
MLWIDGERVDDAERLFSAQERGVLLGDGLFETLRIERGRPLLLMRHLKRLEAAAQTLRFTVDAGSLEAIARQAASEFDHASMRITVLRGEGPRGLLPPTDPQHRSLVSVSPSGARQPASRKAIIAQVRRNEGSPLSRLKCVSYAEQVIARIEAQEAGADDAIMLNNRGEPASTSCANLLVATADGWVTPPVKTGLLPGIVREVFIEEGLVVEAPVRLETIRTHALLRTNSLIGVEPLQLDNGPAASPHDVAVLTEALRAAETREA